MTADRTTLSDHELLDAWRAGDARAGQALFERHKTGVTNLFRRNVRSKHDIPDLVQQTFLACIDTTNHREIGGSVRGWLLGVAFHTMTRFFRKQRSQPGLAADGLVDETLAALEPDPDYLLQLDDEQRLLGKALRRIDHKYQLLFELNYWEKVPCDQIAGILGLPQGTVRSRMQLGRKALQKKLAELADSPELLMTTTMSIAAWQKGLRDFIGALPRPAAKSPPNGSN